MVLIAALALVQAVAPAPEDLYFRQLSPGRDIATS